MSFFSDLFEGNFNKLGTDITHAPESLAKHPSELYETLGGAAALATGGLALGGLGALGGAEGAAAGAGGLEGLLGGGGAEAGGVADAFAAGSSSDLATAESLSAAAGGGVPLPTASPFAVGDVGLPANIGGYLGGGGDVTGALGGTGGGTFFDSSAAASAYGGGGGGAPAAGGFNISDPSTYLPAAGLTPVKAAGVALGAGALGYDVLKGNKPLADQSALQAQGTQLSAQGQQFMSYLQQGTLPPGLQTLVDKQTNAAKAMAIANAAKNGQSTDPTTNTQLADAINSAQQQATAQVAQLGTQLFQQGLSETQVSAQIMQYLTNLDEQQTANMGKSIAAFAASLAGGGGTTLKLAA